MKKNSILIFLAIIIFSCTHNNKKEGSVNSITPRIKSEIVDIAINYAMDKFKESKKTVTKDGVVTIVDIKTNDMQIKYIIDPAKIEVGLIDGDKNEDAIITISSAKGQYLEMPEHLFLIKTDGKFMLNRVIESDMKILKINDRIIFAEVPTLAPDSPNYNCATCREVVKYKYINGNLVRTE